MGANLGKLKHKRHQPDATKVKKHSDFARSKTTPVVVGGARTKTDTGYIASGFKGKSFETYFEHMLPSSSTATFRHEKKDKTIRVLSGLLFVILNDGKLSSQVKAMAGDEVVLERGTTYRLATSAEEAQIFVCQSAKYAATLEVVDDSSIVERDVPSHLLVVPALEDRVAASRPQDVPSKRKGSKAKEQLAAQRSARRSSPQIVEVKDTGTVAAAALGNNPRPSLGRFSEDGAG